MAPSSTLALLGKIRRKYLGTSVSKNMKLYAHSHRYSLRRKRLAGIRDRHLIIMELLILLSGWIK